MPHRWLARAGLAALVVAAFVVAPTAARAAAGLRVDDIACCCPDPTECRCHDHEDGGHGDARLETCGDVGELVPLVVVLAVVPPPPHMPPAPRAIAAPPPRSVPAPEDRPSRPVTPPF